MTPVIINIILATIMPGIAPNCIEVNTVKKKQSSTPSQLMCFIGYIEIIPNIMKRLMIIGCLKINIAIESMINAVNDLTNKRPIELCEGSEALKILLFIPYRIPAS